MNLNHLRFAFEVSRTGSFTEASKICCVTQPTLSNGIQLLETTLGGKLFTRTTRNVSLSPFGEHMMPAIQHILEAKIELTGAAERYFKPDHRLLSIGFSPLVDMRLIQAIVEPFITAETGVTTYYKECFMNSLHTRISAGQVSMVIRPRLEHAGITDTLEKQSFYSEPVFAILSEGVKVPGSNSGPINIQQLANETIVLTPDGCGHAPATRAWFSACNVKLKEYPGQAMSYQVMQDWAGLGLASAILPWSKITPENRPNARQLILNKNQPAMIEFELVWQLSAAAIEPLASFLNFFCAKAKPIVAGLHLAEERFVAGVNS